MTDWIQSVATIILGVATIALFWVTKTLAHSTDQLARISGQDFRAKHSPLPHLMWHKDTPAIEGGNIVLKGAIRPFPGCPAMILIHILAESSVEIADAGPHVETLHESWPARPLALDYLHEFACPVPELRAAAADLKIGVTVTVARPAEPKDATASWTAISELRTRPRRQRLGNPTHRPLLAPRVDLSIVVNGRDAVIRDDAEAAIWYRRAAEHRSNLTRFEPVCAVRAASPRLVTRRLIHAQILD